MAAAALNGVLQNLRSLAETELGSLLGFDLEKTRLDSMFNAIKAILEDAEEKQFSDRAIKDWLGKLKDAAYELEDILDECAYEELSLEYGGVKCCVSEMVLNSSCSFHPMHLVFRYQIAKRMESVNERLDEIAEERNKFHFTEMVPERSGVTEWRQTISFSTEPQVYGREEDKDKILDFLVGDSSHYEDLSVYPIVGLGGLGKTTLAQLIFNHERVVKHFELRIWLCVSEDFSFKRMTKDIIEAASGRACEDLDLEPLKRRLQELLQRKRYLLVLDDVWDDEPDKWERLKAVLVCGAKGSFILVTTRLPRVAEIMGTMPPHELSLLSDNDCWELFKHRAFRPNEEEHTELVVIGKEIVKKCRGVPLAAKALGGLLRFKRDKHQWLIVKESNLLELSHTENSIMYVLRLSYLNLPIGLRQCFAYCAIFHKDEVIEKQYLIDLWMANGFISSSETLDAQDVGDGVWNELYWRSFFQDIERDEFGIVTSFKMHDLVHDLAQLVAEDVCCITNDNNVTTLFERKHHLSDHRRRRNVDSIQLQQVKSLRSYIDFCNSGQHSPVVFKCYSLRVLHYEQREELSSSIGYLKHLRYLNLSNGGFKTLPESLCKLWNLQILKLDGCHCLQRLPNSLIRLRALRQLSLKRCNLISSLPPQIGKLTSLRSLSTYFVGKERGFLLEELGPLKLKGDLHIKHLEKVKDVMDAKEADMSSKQLNELWLSWDRNEESELQKNVEEILEVLQPDTQQLERLSVVGYEGVHFPQWMSSPSLKYLSLEQLPNLKGLSREDGENLFLSLSTLEISECPKLLGLPFLNAIRDLVIKDCDSIKSLPQGLHSLKDLSISRCREVEGLHEALQHTTALHSLKLSHLPKLEFLPDCFGNLHLLRELNIGYCPNLRCLPMSLSRSSLERLWISTCPVLERRCQKESGEDWPKINHIPHVHVGRRR